MNLIDKIAYILLVIGGLNWGFTVFDFNLVNAIFQAGTTMAKIVYGLVGVSALYGIYTFIRRLG